MSITNELKSIDKSTMIHIAGEAIVTLGLVFYFSNKNKRLSSHIEELAQRIEEQEDQIQKLENNLAQVNIVLTKLSQRMESVNIHLSQSQPIQTQPVSRKKIKNTVNQTPDNQTPMVQTPMNQTPMNQTPMNQTPMNQTPMNQTPMNQTPMNQTPMVQTPVIISAFPMNFSRDKKHTGQIREIINEEDEESDLDEEIQIELNELNK